MSSTKTTTLGAPAGALAAGTGAAGVLCATGAGLAVIAAAARNLLWTSVKPVGSR